MGRMFVMGDIHGAYRALRQCLEKAAFDYRHDHLICLGDVTDGWPETKAAVDELLKIKHLDYVLGNHDWWTLQWMESGRSDDIWVHQGGAATMQSYAGGVPDSHRSFFDRALLYFIHENRLFVHAGINPRMPVEGQGMDTYLWDRTLAATALHSYGTSEGQKLSSFEEIYIGHTPIQQKQPIRSFEVWLMDTGAGWSGVLSMMNVHTKEMFCSDPVPALYPGIEGRRKRSF